MSVPNDPMILLSYINTQLRDFYPSLEEFCKSCGESEEQIKSKLSELDYFYNEKLNKFI